MGSCRRAERGDAAGGGQQAAVSDALPITLDRFLAKHTSEDNASFADLLADMNARRWAKAPWLLTDGTQVAPP